MVVVRERRLPYGYPVQSACSPQLIAPAAAPPIVLPVVIPAAIAVEEEFAAAARANEAADRLQAQAAVATRLAAERYAAALAAAKVATAEAHIYADQLSRAEAEMADECAIADCTLDMVQAATHTIDQTAAARDVEATPQQALSGVDADPEAAHPAPIAHPDEVSWSRLHPAGYAPADDQAADTIPEASVPALAPVGTPTDDTVYDPPAAPSDLPLGPAADAPVRLLACAGTASVFPWVMSDPSASNQRADNMRQIRQRSAGPAASSSAYPKAKPP